MGFLERTLVRDFTDMDKLIISHKKHFTGSHYHQVIMLRPVAITAFL